MRDVIRVIFLASLCLLLGPAARTASAVTIDDLVNLKANGLGDDILVALIETDGSAFHLSPADVITIRKRGLGDAVIVAMIRTTQRPVQVPADASVAPAVADTSVPAAPQPATAAAPTVIQVQQTVVQRVEKESRVTVVEVPVPVAVPVFLRPIAPVPLSPPAPVYWGFGGNRRPDSWVPASEQKAVDPSAKKP